MADLLFVLLATVFFALAVAYVRGCTAVMGPGVTDSSRQVDEEPTDESGVAA